MIHKKYCRSGITLICALALQTTFGQTYNYPFSKKVNQTDNYFGTNIDDPYRWLEDDNSSETASWVTEENKVTEDYLSKIPDREKIKKRLTTLWNFPKQTTPLKKGNNYFYYANDGLQNQFTLQMREGLNGKTKTVIDPNTLSKDGTTNLNGYEVSKDGKFLAYNLAKAGSDWSEINVLNTETLNPFSEKIEWVKFSGIAWQGNGFYYSRYDAPDSSNVLKGKNEFHKVYFHQCGTPQQNDQLIYEDKSHPLRNFGAEVTSDENFLIVSAGESTHGNELYAKDLRNKNSSFKTISSGFDAECHVIDNNNDWIYIMTNRNASRYKLIAVNALNPTETKLIIPETEDVLQNVTFSKSHLIALYMKDASSRIKVFSKEGKFLFDIDLPTLGSVNELSANKKDDNIFYSFISFISPATIYQVDLTTKNQLVFFKPKIDFDAEAYETKQIFYPSKDGTKIPMFLTYKKGLDMKGNNPVLIFGYGGFNVSRTPDIKIERLVFIENGGIFASPCLRGGGEYGEQWHEAGTKLKKQNVFDDFIAAAEYLIKEKYTNPSKIAISGRSNGGLLVGACMMQRPDLFKVALPAVGVMDMLRYHKFTIGWAWKGDYGSSEDEANFKNLYAYSPLHNIKTGINYPATLVTTGDHDDRVVPAHSFKFIATLQEKYKGPNPALIRIDINSGHASTTITGSSKPVAKQIDEQTDVYSFTMFNLGMTIK